MDESTATAGASVATVLPKTRSVERPVSQHELASAQGSEPRAEVSNGARGTARADGTAYQLATLRHFTNAEALITTYASSARDRKVDAQLAAWSRDLLSQTRLLLDSPAADDPARRKLLQDLELVLVQMTQLSPSTTPIDRDLIDGSVRKGDMITRLRTAVPAGGATHLNGV